MKLCHVTGPLPIARGLPELKGISFVALRDRTGDTLAAADLLGVREGDQVLVTEGGAGAVLGTNHPADALVVGVVAGRAD